MEHWPLLAPSHPPAAVVAHVGWHSTLGKRPQPSLAPSDYRARLKAATKLRNKAFCETRNHRRSRKQQELRNPRSPLVRHSSKHLCPPLKQAAWHIPETTRVPTRLSSRKTSLKCDGLRCLPIRFISRLTRQTATDFKSLLRQTTSLHMDTHYTCGIRQACALRHL